jgi:hypothetical protein
MKARCNNPKDTNYHKYGERGIKVCDDWMHNWCMFRDWAMTHGYQDDLTIDRKDNDGDYTPDNCRWATITEQNNNKRVAHNITMVTIGDITDTIPGWSKRTGISYNTLFARYHTYGYRGMKFIEGR